MYQEINVEYLSSSLISAWGSHKEACKYKAEFVKNYTFCQRMQALGLRGEKASKGGIFLCVWLQSNQASPAPTGKFTLIKLVLPITFPSPVTQRWALNNPPCSADATRAHIQKMCLFFPSKSLLRSKLDETWCWRWALPDAGEVAGSAQHMEQLSTGIFRGPDLSFLSSVINTFHLPVNKIR